MGRGIKGRTAKTAKIHKFLGLINPFRILKNTKNLYDIRW